MIDSWLMLITWFLQTVLRGNMEESKMRTPTFSASVFPGSVERSKVEQKGGQTSASLAWEEAGRSMDFWDSIEALSLRPSFFCVVAKSVFGVHGPWQEVSWLLGFIKMQQV